MGLILFLALGTYLKQIRKVLTCEADKWPVKQRFFFSDEGFTKFSHLDATLIPSVHSEVGNHSKTTQKTKWKAFYAPKFKKKIDRSLRSVND